MGFASLVLLPFTKVEINISAALSMAWIHRRFLLLLYLLFSSSFSKACPKYLNLLHVNTFHSIDSPNLVPVSMNSSNVYLPLQGLLRIVDLLLRWFVFNDKLMPSILT